MEIPRITTEEVAQRIDEGERAAFVDSRSAAAFEQATHHIPGSVRIAPGEVDGHTAGLPRDATVVVYCT